jgi:hypothetical protein
LIELATTLGCTCLEDERNLATCMLDGRIERWAKDLRALVAATNHRAWQQRPAGGFGALLDTPEIANLLRRLEPLSPVDELAILRGLCDGPLRLFYEELEGKITLRRGTPLPHATRPIQKLKGVKSTPYQQGITARELLGRTGFDLFRESNQGVRVVVDFSHRQRLDEITWPERLPHVGTIHPRLDGSRLDYQVTGRGVFDVRPKQWSQAQTMSDLEAVGTAEIGLLPELCLPAPDALEAALAANPLRYPRLVVAGSAHKRINDSGRSLAVNECRTYIDGELVHTHRKIHALETRQIGNHRFEEPIREDITATPAEITLLSGERTRMAVLICADMNEGLMPRVLEECGVNLLLVPSLTYRTGAFNGTVCQLASHTQALCVVANPILDRLAGARRRPFLVLASVPREAASQQSREYFAPPRQTAVRALLDPNQQLTSKSALRWI